MDYRQLNIAVGIISILLILARGAEVLSRQCHRAYTAFQVRRSRDNIRYWHLGYVRSNNTLIILRRLCSLFTSAFSWEAMEINRAIIYRSNLLGKFFSHSYENSISYHFTLQTGYFILSFPPDPRLLLVSSLPIGTLQYSALDAGYCFIEHQVRKQSISDSKFSRSATDHSKSGVFVESAFFLKIQY